MSRVAELLMAAGARGGAPFGVVHSAVYGISGTSSSRTIEFPAEWALEPNDLVVLYFGVGGKGATASLSGYTVVADLFSDDFYDTTLLVGYKFMGATPDTGFTLPNGTGSSLDAGAVIVFAIRGVDLNTPVEVTTTATGINSVYCDPPSITPLTLEAIIISGGAGAHVEGVQTYSSSSFDGFLTKSQNDSADVTIGAGHKEWLSGAFNPGPFGFSGGDSVRSSWAAASIAIRPA